MRVAVATNEPWGTYHLRPLLPALERRGIEVVHLVPDLDRVPPGAHAPLAVGPAVDNADLLVVSGFTDWPLRCALANAEIPLIASGLAYMGASLADAPASVRSRLLAITAASRADADTFAVHLGVDPATVAVVGNPVLDTHATSVRRGHTLVLTSVTRPDATGGSAPGTELLSAAAHALEDAGHDVVVRLHPREDPDLWRHFAFDTSPNARDAAFGARLVLGIPGTAYAEVAAQGVPLVGIAHPLLNVPQHLRDLCGATLTSNHDLNAWATSVDTIRPVGDETVHHAVGPRGSSGDRLTAVWATVAASPSALDDLVTEAVA